MLTPGRINTSAAALLAAALALTGIQDAYSQTTNPRATTTTDGSGTDLVGTTRPSDLVTGSIRSNLRSVNAECGRYDPIYRIDCLRQRLLDIARRIPQGPAYSEARRIIARASDKLGVIQARNIDTGKPRQRSRGNARLKESKVYSAIKRENLNKAMEQARQVIEEAETLLLRASENSEKRASHYRQIAAAVGSTKVLLRSA